MGQYGVRGVSRTGKKRITSPRNTTHSEQQGAGPHAVPLLIPLRAATRSIWVFSLLQAPSGASARPADRGLRAQIPWELRVTDLKGREDVQGLG